MVVSKMIDGTVKEKGLVEDTLMLWLQWFQVKKTKQIYRFVPNEIGRLQQKNWW